jgi:hypothetical protein
VVQTFQGRVGCESLQHGPRADRLN